MISIEFKAVITKSQFGVSSVVWEMAHFPVVAQFLVDCVTSANIFRT